MKSKPPRLPSRPILSLRVVGLAWVILFVAWFYSFTLPNNKYSDGSAISRRDVWRALPDLLDQNLFPIRLPGLPPSGWSFLPQRFDLLAVAGVILAGAWSLGHLPLRLIGLHRPLDALERTVFAFGLGLSGLSLLTMAGGVAGMLNRWAFVGAIAVFAAGEMCCQWREYRASVGAAKPQAEAARPREFSLVECATVACVTPFVLAMLLGSMLPPTDFDVKEYHLQGPKEYFQQGRVTFLPHNVYTSFPFLTEMLSLLAMVLRGDWFRGALAGQAVLMTFAPLTALALFAAGRRWFNSTAGWMAVLVYLTTPWVYRISIIAYAEGGLTFFLFAALLAVMLGHASVDETARRRLTLLAGFMAGSAVACKYPGVISVAFPLGAAAVAAAFFHSGGPGSRRAAASAAPSMPAQQELRPPGARPNHVVATAVVFTIGLLITFGPWMLKNLAETGNPVYPLLYTVFGGTDWNDAMNAKWRSGHSAPAELLRDPSRIPADLRAHAVDVAAKSDWQSPLMFGFAPLALLWRGRRRMSLALWGYVFWLFFTWWALTHRIDRFWIPMLPVTSLLAGVGLAWLLGTRSEPVELPADGTATSGRATSERAWTGAIGQLIIVAGAVVVVLAAVLFNLGFVTSTLAGYNAYLIDLETAKQQAATPGIRLLNELSLPSDARVLLVGEAEVFDAQFDHVYNTVFDECLFQQWTSAAAPDVADGDQPLRPMGDIRSTLLEHGITHVFVNWQEILRYREPGSYGFTEFVTPQRIRDLEAGGVLREISLDPQRAWVPWQSLGPGAQAEVERWGTTLRKQLPEQDFLIRYQLFAVSPP